MLEFAIQGIPQTTGVNWELMGQVARDQPGILEYQRKQAGMTMLLVEQNLALATELADDVVILGKGRVRWTGTAQELRKADEVRHTWLGV